MRHPIRRWLAVAAFAYAMPVAAQQRIDPGNWFDVLDLPRPLLERLDRGGKVGLSVAVDAEGRAKGCRITSSSTIAELDVLTCEIAVRRGRYIPAHDAAGTAVPGQDRLSVDWRLLAPPSPAGWTLSPKAEDYLTERATFTKKGVAKSGLVAIEITASATGKATECKVTRSSGTPAFDKELCRKILGLRSITLAATDASRAAPDRRLGLELTWRLRPDGFSMAIYPTTIVP